MLKKRILILCLVLAMSTALLAGCSNGSGSTQAPASASASASSTAKNYNGVSLVVCTWGGSTGDATKQIAADFEKKYGCTVVIDGINANSDRIAKLQSEVKSGNVEDDVVYFSGSFANQAKKLDLFEKIDPSVITNTGSLYSFAVPKDSYGPMVCVGRFGIMYNADLLKEKGLEPPKSYKDLFDPKYAGLVALPAMTATAGPYVFAAINKELGGDLNNSQPGMDFYNKNKGNIKLWYTTDLVSAMTQKEAAITVYEDLFLPSLQKAGLNMKWVDASEGNFADDVYINVVKGSPNKELAQLFIQYALSKETQEQFLKINNEAPTNKSAQMSTDQQAFLAYGQEALDKCTFFDYDQMNSVKSAWTEQWQKMVSK